MSEIINKEIYEEFFISVQNKVINLLARETEKFMHKMPKNESDQICGYAASHAFASGISLILSNKDIPDDNKKIILNDMLTIVCKIHPIITEQLNKFFAAGYWDRVMQGKEISAHKIEDFFEKIKKP